MLRFFFILIIISSHLIAGELSFQGEVRGESRYFSDDDNIFTKDYGVGFFGRFEGSYEWNSGKGVIRSFGRTDINDSSRNTLALEEAYLSHFFGKDEGLKGSIGYKIFNWTAMEAFHPSDFINSRVHDGNLEQFDKLGELTLEMSIPLGEGELQLLYFPRFLDPIYPEKTNRIGGGINFSRPLIVSEGIAESKVNTTQYGGAFSGNWGDADILFFYLDYIDRQRPLVGLHPINKSDIFTPYYFRTRYLGGTFQKAFESIILKLETVYKDLVDTNKVISPVYGTISPRDHYDIAFGIEYSLGWNQGSETSLLFEGQGTFGLNKRERARVETFQRDLLFGVRHAFNDILGKELFFSTIIDIERGRELVFNSYYSSRINDSWKYKISLRAYYSKQQTSIPIGLNFLDKDDHIEFSLSRYF